jgi:hypothetical protein
MRGVPVVTCAFGWNWFPTLGGPCMYAVALFVVAVELST